MAASVNCLPSVSPHHIPLERKPHEREFGELAVAFRTWSRAWRKAAAQSLLLDE